MKNKCPLVIHVYENRKRRERSLDTNDFKTALGLIQNMVLDGKDKPDSAPKTVEKAITDWLASEEKRGIKYSTLKSFKKFLNGNPKRKDDPNYSQTLLAFAQENGITYMRDFTPELCDAARGKWKLNGRAHEVQAERYKQFFKALFDMGVIPTNPAKDLKKPNVTIDPVIAFDRDQRKRLLQAVKDEPRLLAANWVLYTTGLAPVDLVQLGPNKFKERNGSWYIVTRRMKTGKRVKVKVPKFVASLLHNLPTYPCGLWFWNRENANARHETATGNLRRKMRAYFRSAEVWLKDEDGAVVYGPDGGPELGFLYQWRHTFVHRHLMKGTPIDRIAQMLGDDVATVNDNYSHFIDERQEGLDQNQDATFSDAEFEC